MLELVIRRSRRNGAVKYCETAVFDGLARYASVNYRLVSLRVSTYYWVAGG